MNTHTPSRPASPELPESAGQYVPSPDEPPVINKALGSLFPPPSQGAGLPTPDMSWQHLANTRTLQLDSVNAQLAAARAEVATGRTLLRQQAEVLERMNAQLATAKEELEEAKNSISGLAWEKANLEEGAVILRSDLAKANAAVEAERKAASACLATKDEKCREAIALTAQLSAQQSAPPESQEAALAQMYENLVRVCESKLGVSSLLAEPIELQVERALSVPPEARAVEAAAIVDNIVKLCDHNIPHYAYGDNEAACDMANRLDDIHQQVMELEAIIQRVCFPPGEEKNVEWAKAVESEMDALIGRVRACEKTISLSERIDLCTDIGAVQRRILAILNRAPRPTAAREAEHVDELRMTTLENLFSAGPSRQWDDFMNHVSEAGFREAIDCYAAMQQKGNAP